MKMLDDLDSQFGLGPDLMHEIEQFYENKTGDKDFVDNEMQEILKVLPNSLKLEFSTFIYKHAIQVTQFLKDRESNFYINFLDKLNAKNFY